MLNELSFDTYMQETTRLNEWYLHNLPQTSYKELFYKQDPDYLYLVSVDQYHMKYKKHNIYYVFLSNSIKDKKGCYKTTDEDKALQIANDFYKQAKKDLIFR